jgi:hypothetical protein
MEKFINTSKALGFNTDELILVSQDQPADLSGQSPGS